jgi:hypothetical protein
LSCRACGEHLKFPSERETANAPTDEYAFVVPKGNEPTEANPPPIVVRGRRRARRPEPVDSPPPRILLPLVIGAALVALLGPMCLWIGAKTAGIVLIGAISLLFPLAWFLILDRIYRDRIREQLEGVRCEVMRISWQPFQGLMLDKGWKQRRRCRFYEVEYTGQDGLPRTELCAIGLWIGPLWGDEIDSCGGESDFGSGHTAQMPRFVLGAIVIFASYATFVEVRYAMSGRTVEGKITRVSQVWSFRPFRSNRSRHHPDTRFEYEFTEADGTVRQGAVDKTALQILAYGEPAMRIEYVPGARGWSRLAGDTYLVWVFVLNGFVVLLAGLKLADYFDVLGLHRQRE